jgi:hypothetical protein
MFNFLANLALAPVRVLAAPIKIMDDLARGESVTDTVLDATVGTAAYVVTGNVRPDSAVHDFATVGEK